jgi:hypothetical protein
MRGRPLVDVHVFKPDKKVLTRSRDRSGSLHETIERLASFLLKYRVQADLGGPDRVRSKSAERKNRTTSSLACRRRRSPNRSGNLLVLFPQLVRDCHHSGLESVMRFFGLLLQLWTANYIRNARHISLALGRGVDKDMEDCAYAIWTHFTKPSLSD